MQAWVVDLKKDSWTPWFEVVYVVRAGDLHKIGRTVGASRNQRYVMPEGPFNRYGRWIS
jgi:hypothetical protein